MFDSTHLYNYKAVVTSVYDGDTCTVDIDLGMGVWLKGEKIRLYGINTPELRGAERTEGLRARDYLRSLVLDEPIMLSTVKDRRGKYGRYLGTLWLQDTDDTWMNINEKLVHDGYGEFKDY